MPDKVSFMLKKFICKLKKPTCISEVEDNFRIPFCGVILLLMRATLGEQKGRLLRHPGHCRGPESMGSQWTTVKTILPWTTRWLSGQRHCRQLRTWVQSLGSTQKKKKKANSPQLSSHLYSLVMVQIHTQINRQLNKIYLMKNRKLILKKLHSNCVYSSLLTFGTMLKFVAK